MADLTPDDVANIARLCRLEVPEGEMAAACARLSAVLGYVERLAELDLSGVEPLTHVGEEVNRLAADEPGESLLPKRVMEMAPDAVAFEVFLGGEGERGGGRGGVGSEGRGTREGGSESRPTQDVGSESRLTQTAMFIRVPKVLGDGGGA